MPTRTPRGRIPELDGLRGTAIIMVFLLHYITDASGGAFGSFLYRFRSVFRLGWSGVDLFFVLSGFLIGGILLDARNSPRYFRTFYVRRAFRILPIYYLWLSLYLVAALAFSYWLASPLRVDPALLRHLPLYYLFIQSFQSLAPGTLGWYWFAVCWSVAIEEQFYLVAAPLVRFLNGPKLLFALASTIVFCPLLRWLIIAEWPSRAGLIYVLMPCRADSLAIGMLTAAAWKHPGAHRWLKQHRMQLTVAAFVLLAGTPIFTKWFSDPYTRFAALVEYQWLAVMFACVLLVALLDAQGVIARVMRLGWLGRVGQLSYCIYLIHLPILGLSYAVLLHSPERRLDTASGVAVTIFAALLTYGVAQLSWTFLEGPMIHRGHQYKY